MQRTLNNEWEVHLLSLSAEGVVPVQTIEVACLHLLQLFGAIDMGHLDEHIVRVSRIPLQVNVDFFFVSHLRVARLLDEVLAQACDAASLGIVLVSLHHALGE